MSNTLEPADKMIAEFKQEDAILEIANFVKEVKRWDKKDFPPMFKMECAWCHLQVGCKYFYMWNDQESYTCVCESCYKKYTMMADIVDTFEFKIEYKRGWDARSKKIGKA